MLLFRQWWGAFVCELMHLSYCKIVCVRAAISHSPLCLRALRLCLVVSCAGLFVVHFVLFLLFLILAKQRECFAHTLGRSPRGPQFSAQTLGDVPSAFKTARAPDGTARGGVLSGGKCISVRSQVGFSFRRDLDRHRKSIAGCKCRFFAKHRAHWLRYQPRSIPGACVARSGALTRHATAAMTVDEL